MTFGSSQINSNAFLFEFIDTLRFATVYIQQQKNEEFLCNLKVGRTFGGYEKGIEKKEIDLKKDYNVEKERADNKFERTSREIAKRARKLKVSELIRIWKDVAFLKKFKASEISNLIINEELGVNLFEKIKTLQGRKQQLKKDVDKGDIVMKNEDQNIENQDVSDTDETEKFDLIKNGLESEIKNERTVGPPNANNTKSSTTTRKDPFRKKIMFFTKSKQPVGQHDFSKQPDPTINSLSLNQETILNEADLSVEDVHTNLRKFFGLTSRFGNFAKALDFTKNDQMLFFMLQRQLETSIDNFPYLNSHFKSDKYANKKNAVIFRNSMYLYYKIPNMRIFARINSFHDHTTAYSNPKGLTIVPNDKNSQKVFLIVDLIPHIFEGITEMSPESFLYYSKNFRLVFSAFYETIKFCIEHGTKMSVLFTQLDKLKEWMVMRRSGLGSEHFNWLSYGDYINVLRDLFETFLDTPIMTQYGKKSKEVIMGYYALSVFDPDSLRQLV